MAYIETQRKIVYDTLKAFQGGRVTDESKVGFSQNKELLALENFRDNEYYPISGALLTQAKQELTKLVQTAFQTPVDRIDDSRQSTDYQRSDES